MEIYRRGRAVEDICAKREHLEKVLDQMRMAKRIDELRHDRLFESTVVALRNRIRLIWGDYPDFMFRYDPSGRNHRKGDVYSYHASYGYFSKIVKGKPQLETEMICGFEAELEPMKIASLASVTADEIVQAVDLLIVRDVLNI